MAEKRERDARPTPAQDLQVATGGHIPDEPMEHDKATDAVTEALEEGREDAQWLKAERMVLGQAPPLDSHDPRPREVKEREAFEAMGYLEPADSKLLKRAAGGLTRMTVESDTDISDRAVRERTSTLTGGMATTETADPRSTARAVTIQGVTFIAPTGEDVAVPENVAQVLENEARPVRIMQMIPGSDVIDLRELPENQKR